MNIPINTHSTQDPCLITDLFSFATGEKYSDSENFFQHFKLSKNVHFPFNRFAPTSNCTCVNHKIIFFWLGPEILPYIQFAYFNIFFQDYPVFFTKICDVTLPELSRVT